VLYIDSVRQTPHRKEIEMNSIEKALSAPHLVMCLAGELGVTPSLIVEAIKETPALLKITNAYGRGESNYQQVLNAIIDNDIF
jgi:hypothetical protein